VLSQVAEKAPKEAVEKPFAADLAEIRSIATVLPGPLPVAVNGSRIAVSIRPRKFVIGGSEETPVPMPRTAYQIVYPDCTVMIDSGFDQATHESFGGNEPFFPEEFAKLKRALDHARLIVLTHHHADHVGGVVTAGNFAALAAKTVISADTAHCMVHTPHRPHLKLDDAAVGRFIVHDYAKYYPVAPGVVLFKAPGHSADSQMVYVRLQSGREILHSVDSAWNMDNVRLLAVKAAPWVKEDKPQVLGELRWLKTLIETERDLTILITHDEELFTSLTGSGKIGGQLAF
jgi:glyoxylase-like metal-dependent hydrolase (beta-lactamase superfamily II)